MTPENLKINETPISTLEAAIQVVALLEKPENILVTNGLLAQLVTYAHYSKNNWVQIESRTLLEDFNRLIT